MKLASLLLVATLSSFALSQTPGSQFAPPRATVHFAPDRTCDLLNVAISLDIDYPNRAIKGTVVNTMKVMRSGVSEVVLHAGKDLVFSSVKLDGKTAAHRRNGKKVIISTGRLAKGKTIAISISYSAKNQRGSSFGAGGGWHWIQPRNNTANMVGFWTQGETEYNSDWVPTWDYPNDFATSETKTTVQTGWDVVGNGVLVSAKPSADKKRKTYHWKMTQPHATYLISLVGGPFDIKKDVWEDVPLWYVVPKGDGYLIEDSFGHTKDMLTFFSKAVGVKYPWPKYAQNAMYDFGGGMENVSSTTLGEGALTEARDGWFNMDGLNAHELAHQWFGDLVTCKDWGDIWLNESFATFMQGLYYEHSRGKDAYQWEINNYSQGYFGEARRYKRALSTKLYLNADSMFDAHAYPKGAAILHTMRRMLGDEGFFAGLKLYLTRWRHSPVESTLLRRAMTEATGVNLEPFWAQWIEKPGHPVLDYSWTYADGKVRLTVKQTHGTADGSPIYDIPAKVDFISSTGAHRVLPIRLSKVEETFELQSFGEPAAVVLDPELDFLREIPELHWSDAELPVIARFARSAPDRAEALRRMIAKPTDENVRVVTQLLSADMGRQPVFRDVNGLANAAKPELRAFWTGQLGSQNFDRQAAAVLALGKLPQEASTVAKLRSLVNEKAPITVVVNAINVLAAWDKKGNADVFEKAKGIKDRRGAIKRAAERALAAG